MSKRRKTAKPIPRSIYEMWAEAEQKVIDEYAAKIAATFHPKTE